MKLIGPAWTMMTFIIISLTINNGLDDIDWISIVWIIIMIGSIVASIFFIYLIFIPIHSYSIESDEIEITGMRLIKERTILIKDIIFIGSVLKISGRKKNGFPGIIPAKNRKLKDYSDEKVANLILIITREDNEFWYYWISPKMNEVFLDDLSSRLINKNIVNNNEILNEILNECDVHLD